MATARKRRWQTVAKGLKVYKKGMTGEEFWEIYKDIRSKGLLPDPDPFMMYDNPGVPHE